MDSSRESSNARSLTRIAPATGRLAAGLLVAGFLSTCLLASGCGGGDDGSTADKSADGVLRVVGLDTQDFNADSYTATAGELTVEFSLAGFQAHTLVIEGREGELRLVVENGGTDTGTITLEPGRYILYCDIAGHRQSGMEARLLVE
ncbi:MAG: hypothetical protein P8Q20_00015 [Acidimicrobiales bacterium]|jgi:plastocyanin|nr:hypothetical protein [Acidimicrobiales bacterium]